MNTKIMMIRSPALTSMLSRTLSSTITAINQKLLPETSQIRSYGKDAKVCTECCKNVSQTEGRQLQGPIEEPTLPYRAGCPAAGSKMPLNYDPYRIKVPEMAVPPLPPSNAKWQGLVLSDDRTNTQDNSEKREDADQLKKEEQEESLFEPMMEVAKQSMPCSGKGPPPAPPCPTPPPPPFNWIYTLIASCIFTVLALAYKYWLYLEALNESGVDKPTWSPRKKVRKPPSFEDLPACVQYLIIGTGPAGWGAYEAIRKYDIDAKVFFLTKDDTYPYSRFEMSKHMWYNGLPPDIKNLYYIENGTRKTMYYDECENFMDAVEWARVKGPATSIAYGWCLSRIDADEHIAFVDTPCGEVPIYYDRCLFAPGSYAKNLQIFTKAPKFVRDRAITLRDVRDLETAYRKVVEAKHVTVIGAGPLGCELAYYMGRMQKNWYPQPADEEYVQPEITLVYKDKGVLGGVLPEYLGEWAAEKIKCEHVKVIPQAQVYDAFESEDGRLELTLSNGTSLRTDYVLVALGAEPNTDVAELSFLETDPVNGGYLVNTEFNARSHLYIAGDAASYYSQWKDTRMRLEHDLNARAQGYIAGTNMAGYWEPTNMEPHWWLNLGKDINMQVVGEVGACMPTVGMFKPCDQMEEEKSRESDEKWGEFKRPCFKDTYEYRNRYKRGIMFYCRDEIVVGIIFWNFEPVIADRMEVATELLRARVSYKEVNLLAELLGFPAMICARAPPEKQSDLPRGPCLREDMSVWLKYEDYEKTGILSEPMMPRTFIYRTRAEVDAEEAAIREEEDRIAKALAEEEAASMG